MKQLLYSENTGHENARSSSKDEEYNNWKVYSEHEQTYDN
jgi:hypothetical protein